MRRAVAYARFSSSGQREESIDAQIRAIKKYCLDKEIDLVGIYKDSAISGRTDDRPGFQQMIKDSAKKQFDYVIVHKLDRFSRDRYDSAVYKRKLKQNDIKLLSVLENLDGSPEAIIMESLLEGMSEYYSANLSREVIKGMRENALKAEFIGGRVPLGYKIIDKKYVINDMEAPAIKTLYTMYDEGRTFADISRKLKEMGHCTSFGNPYSTSSLQKMLRNPLYKGDYKVRFKTGEVIFFKDSVPKIVTKELWERVQDKMSDTSFRSNKKSDYVYLLSGLLYHEDGSPMVGISGTGKTGKTFYYYRCKKCRKAIRADKIENMIIEMFKQIVFSEHNFKVIVDSIYNTLVQEVDSKAIKEYEKKITENKKSIEKLVNALMTTTAGSESITNKITTLEKQNENLEYELLGLKQENSITKEEIREFINSQKNKMDEDRLAMKNMLFMFTEKIEVTKHHINVNLKFIDLTNVEGCSYAPTYGVP